MFNTHLNTQDLTVHTTGLPSKPCFHNHCTSLSLSLSFFHMYLNHLKTLNLKSYNSYQGFHCPGALKFSLPFQLLEVSRPRSFAWTLGHLHSSLPEYYIYLPTWHRIQKIWFFLSGYLGLTDWTLVSTIPYASESIAKKKKKIVKTPRNH